MLTVRSAKVTIENARTFILILLYQIAILELDHVIMGLSAWLISASGVKHITSSKKYKTGLPAGHNSLCHEILQVRLRFHFFRPQFQRLIRPTLSIEHAAIPAFLDSNSSAKDQKEQTR
jgi:hypothetical protein